jgi:hypothetical protein
MNFSSTIEYPLSQMFLLGLGIVACMKGVFLGFCYCFVLFCFFAMPYYISSVKILLLIFIIALGVYCDITKVLKISHSQIHPLYLLLHPPCSHS